MYIITNLYRNILYVYHAIGKTPCYHKWAFIWCFIFVLIVVSEHGFISKCIVMVNLVSIFVDVTFINLRLLLLTY